MHHMLAILTPSAHVSQSDGLSVAESNAFKCECCFVGSGLWVPMNLVSVFYKLSYLLHPSTLQRKDRGGWVHIPSLPQFHGM